MADFPILSVEGPSEPYSEQLSSAGDLVSPAEAGYKISRRQFTRRTLTVKTQYTLLTDADKALLVPFIDTHGTTGAFNWTHPLSAVVYAMRFAKLPEIKRQGNLWAMPVELEEV